MLQARLAAAAALTVTAGLSAGPTEDARQLLLRGNYAEARAAYEKLLSEPAARAAAVVGVSRSRRAVGEYADALAGLESAIKQDGSDAPLDWRAEKADLLYCAGRREEAMKIADAVIAKDADQMLARWVRARVLRDRGDLKEADQAMRWFVRLYTRRNFAGRPITDPEKLTYVALAGAENARRNRLSDQFKFIIREVYPDALKASPDFWPAEYHTGMVLLEKFNRPEALDSFEKALKINPRAADVMVGQGQAALRRFELKEAERRADEALKINPNLVGALCLRADVYLMADDIDECLALLRKAEKINPRDEATLARLALCHKLNRDEPAFQKIVTRVSEFDKKPAVFYDELGQAFEQRRIYSAARQYYEKSRELRPKRPAVVARLGLLYMRLGEEPRAKQALDDAFKADPFHVRVANMRRVLRHLAGYETMKTEHFHVKYDPQKDAALGRFVAAYCEEIYADLKRQFNYAPPGPILVEVFSRHDMFSGRMIALPDLHTIGACTGKMVAMASPDARGLRQKFNWGRVMRHELVHIFNLAQTDYQVPHWLTEGLAVRNEGFDRPTDWIDVLRDRNAEDNLLDLSNIVLAFVRPRSPREWTLAYCQSELYVEFLVNDFGPEVVGKLLAAYADGSPTTREVIKQVCGTDVPTFEARYKKYIEGVLARYGDAEKAGGRKLRTLRELERGYEKSPEDADLAADLADQYRRRRRPEDALRVADAALKRRPGHPRATVVKARLLRSARQSGEALGLIEAALKKHPDDAALLREAGRLYAAAGEWPDAARILERGREKHPLKGDWLPELARAYTKLEDADKLTGVLEKLARRDGADLATRVKLTKLYAAAGKPIDAERMAREALFIDVNNATAREILFESLDKQNKDGEAAKMRQVLGVTQ